MAKSPLKGFKELDKILANAPQELREDIAEAMKFNAGQIVADAANRAPVDMGALQQGIDYVITPTKKLIRCRIIANSDGRSPYAPFVEFGTGRQVQVPPEMEAEARRFANKKWGGFEKGLDNIREWLRRNGGDPDNAYIVFVSILRRGLKPQPFLYPAFVVGRDRFLSDVVDIINEFEKK